MVNICSVKDDVVEACTGRGQVAQDTLRLMARPHAGIVYGD